MKYLLKGALKCKVHTAEENEKKKTTTLKGALKCKVHTARQSQST